MQSYIHKQQTISFGHDTFHYTPDSERDLGVDINKSLNYNEHCMRLISQANQKYGY